MVNGKYLIGIDPGHGGNDPGAISIIPNITESMLTLELSKMVRDRLLRSNKFEVYMTRETDTNPGNAGVRGQMLGKMRCDFGISIHFNAFTNATANGSEIYVPNQEEHGKIEYYIKEGLIKLFRERVPYCKGRNYTNGVINDKSINPKTLDFINVYPNTDYYGVVRESWKYGVSADLLETCYVTNQSDMEIYFANKENVADIIASAIYKAYGVSYIKNDTSTISPSDNTSKDDSEEVKRLKEENDKLKNDIQILENKLDGIKAILF